MAEEINAIGSGGLVASTLSSAPVPYMHVQLHSHHFSCSHLSPRGRDICLAFSRRFVSWSWDQVGGVYTKVPDRVYASAPHDRSVFRFHINALNDFKTALADLHTAEHLIKWEAARQYEPMRFNYQVLPQWKPHDYQVRPIDYLSSPEPIAKLLESQTGKGKSLMAMLAIAKIGERVVGVIKPKYLEKWVEDFSKTYAEFDPKLYDDKIVVVQGSKELRVLLSLAAEDNLPYPIILISNATIRNWISSYERSGDELEALGYACTPERLFEHLRAGIRLVDETHEDFHFFFKLDTYTHVKSSISLTATLISKDPFLNRMYEIMFPPSTRIKKMELDRYVDVVNVLYRFKAPEKVRTEEWGSSTYSHTALEKSIIRHVPTLRNYFALIKNVLDTGYIRDKKPGEKAIVYAATVDMCTKLTKFLAEAYPQLDVRRYVEEDPYENAIEADIRVTTVLSGGTALDIPNLSVAFMTTALDSVQGNIQALGRLRKRDGRMTFYFLTAENIAKHVKYAEAKKLLFQDRAKTYRDMPSGHFV